MKVAFIVPKDNDQHSPLSQFAQCRVLPPVGLARMAGAIGKKANVVVIDERVDTGKHLRQVHIAVIFINSYNRQRAYQLAAQYKMLGSTIVLTGPVLDDALDEARQYADSLFLGSGEDNMPVFLNDYRNDKIKPFYRTSLSKATSATIHPFTGASLSLAS